MNNPLFRILLVLMLVLPSITAGHELWFESSETGMVLFRGHVPGLDDQEDHHGDADAPCPFEQYLRATVMDGEGELIHFPSRETIPAVWPIGCISRYPAGGTFLATWVPSLARGTIAVDFSMRTRPCRSP